MKQTVCDIAKNAGGAQVITSGFSCQPYSRLGDCRGQADTRSSCLTKTLNAAYFLFSQIVVLECVAPAAQDGFVRAEIDRFIRLTGFHCSQIELRLDEVWPTRRHRSWWVLSAADIGEVKLSPWSPLTNVSEVQHVIPALQPWDDDDDEHALSLDEHEMHAFGVIHDTHAKYLLNAKGQCPCALHAWGSQTRACPCGCRSKGFSSERLESKGLHGCLTRSAPLKDGTVLVRHLHPNESMALNAMDPVIDFGSDVRLTLSATGQIASPAQALWVLSSVSAKLAAMRMHPTFEPSAQLQAYRAWLIMRCRHVWPCDIETIHDQMFLSLVKFWDKYHNLSLAEVLYPLRWVGELSGIVSVASVLDHIIREHETIPSTLLDKHKDDEEDLDATPWYDAPSIVDDPTTDGCLFADSCTVVFEGTSDSPIRFQPKCDSTVQQFIDAHQKLVGDLVVGAITLNGVPLKHDHVMQVGQVILIQLLDVQENANDPKDSTPSVSPTAEWTCPAEVPIRVPSEDPIEVHSPPRKVSKFDVGECVIPSKLPDPDENWLDASPFQALQGDQFLKLQMPVIQNAQQLWSIRHQYFRTEDRLALIDAQSAYWADDEMRFHLFALAQTHQEYHARFTNLNPQICVLDPLIATSWIQNKGFDCALWGKDHPEVASKAVPIITAVLVEQHWIPVFMVSVQQVLQVRIWDVASADHSRIDALAQKLASGLGLTSALLCHEHRLFFTSQLCGALAIAFLRGALIGSLLPTTDAEAGAIHVKLRGSFCQELRRCQITRRPWIWGAGDTGGPPDTPESGGRPVVSVTRDERIDLINSNGLSMGDDEIRFHLLKLLDNQPATRAPGLERQFTLVEPLIFSCWQPTGKTIAELWSRTNPQVHVRSQHVVTAFSVQGHWLPVWFSPVDDHVTLHTLHADGLDLSMFNEVLAHIVHLLGFSSHTLHSIPPRVTVHDLCGAQALAFLAHVIMRMPLPDTYQELRQLHTNMRASFVEFLYSQETVPKPVIWGSGLPGESGLLPIMPEEEPFVVPCCAFAATRPFSRSSIWDHFCCCVSRATANPAAPTEHDIRLQRGDMLLAHSYAMGDDEILFHLTHILQCLESRPAESREFVLLPPLELWHLEQGNPDPLHDWIRRLGLRSTPERHVVMILWIQQHWIPVWFAPQPVAMCHVLSDFATGFEQFGPLLRSVCDALGSPEFVTHSVPHGLPTDRLCGVTAVSFIAHIVLGTRLPSDIEQLYARCWNMKQVFWRAMQDSTPTLPTVWGWGSPWESRPLPLMPGWGPLVASLQSHPDVCHDWWLVTEVCPPSTGMSPETGMAFSTLRYHVDWLRQQCIPDLMFEVVSSFHEFDAALHRFHFSSAQGLLMAVLQDFHWSPVICWRYDACCVLAFETCLKTFLARLPQWLTPCELEVPVQVFCGARTFRILAAFTGHCTMMPDAELHEVLIESCSHLCLDGSLVGYGPSGQLVKNLAVELSKHGVPEALTEERALAAIKTLGSEQIATALGHRNPWKQLKTLGNLSKFHFVLPSELVSEIAKNKGKPVTPKGKGKGSSKSVSHAVELEPSKLQIMEGTFQAQTHTMLQLTMKQIGPVSSGVILATMREAEPYLRAGKPVSSEPLALVVLSRSCSDVQTALPHTAVTVPCRCTVNGEPVLAEAVLVQLGTGIVEKATGSALVSVDTPDVVTFKIMVYKDELHSDWNEFCLAPIRCLVSLLPKLKRCLTEGCNCEAWHNEEQLPLRDPILDVWRRQFLRSGFKPCPVDKAEIFSVCIRTPHCILTPMLATSGSSGAYCEPRTPDGKEVLSDFTVVWTPKHSLQQMQHLMQTNPAVQGLARIGERRGLRVHTSQAKTIHQVVRPDSIYLPSGPRTLYTVGPFPFGVDRQAVGKILHAAGWECRPLQPTAPCPGRGAMWLVQSTEEPVQTIIATTTGEIMIAKQKQDAVSPGAQPKTVGSAATLALCGAPVPGKQTEPDPWALQDPWKTYHPTVGPQPASSPAEGLQQIEERIQTAVLAKIHPAMEQDDVPDRVHALEGQVQQLLSKQQSLENNFQEFSGHHSQQLNALQGQVTAQAQQLHGHLENQNQTMQSLFEQQMQQIRGLLAKRPRDDGME